MAGFTDRLKKQVAEVVVSTSMMLPGGAPAQQSLTPPPDNEFSAAILRQELCGFTEQSKGVLRCDSSHVSLEMLNKYLETLQQRENAPPLPKDVAVTFRIAPKLEALHVFETDKIQALARELENRGADKKYPVIIANDANENISVIGRAGESSGVVVIDARVFEQVSVPRIVETVLKSVEAFKRQQKPGVRTI